MLHRADRQAVAAAGTVPRPPLRHGRPRHRHVRRVTVHLQAEDAHASYDGVIEPGMVLAVESYIGEVNGADGVKLEEMILVTDQGSRQLTRFPYEDDLLA